VSVDELLAKASDADDPLETAYWVGEAKQAGADDARVAMEVDE